MIKLTRLLLPCLLCLPWFAHAAEANRPNILFVIPVAAPLSGDGIFASTGERVYVALGVLIGLTVGPMQAASRTLLVRVAPVGKMTEYFGLYALTGKVTSFVGPLAVGAFGRPFTPSSHRRKMVETGQLVSAKRMRPSGVIGRR